MSSIFLSHSSKDKIFVRRLAKRLSKDGIRVWLDEADLKIGDPLIHRISEAIEQADFVGAVISRNSVASNWVQKELSMAATKEIAAKKVIVLPILIDQCEIPDFLKDKMYADFTDRKQFNRVYVKLLETLGRHYSPFDSIELTGRGIRMGSRLDLRVLSRSGGNYLLYSAASLRSSIALRPSRRFALASSIFAIRSSILPRFIASSGKLIVTPKNDGSSTILNFLRILTKNSMYKLRIFAVRLNVDVSTVSMNSIIFC